jgi:hypothetical protein
MFSASSYAYFYKNKYDIVKSKLTLLIIFTFFLFSNSFKCQNTCFYVEYNEISNGKKCLQDTLYFTNNVETYIKGEISANKVIIIKPSQFDIILNPEEVNCNECVYEEGGTTIKTNNKTGGGKGSKMQNSDTLSQYKISLKKNPAKNILEIYNPKSITITQYSIYDSFGKKILSSTFSTNEIKISHLPTGSYRIILSTIENKIFTLTFIKN